MPRLDPDDQELQAERTILETLGRRLRVRRRDREWGVTDVADRSGLSHSYISRLERGLIPRPTLFELRKVSRGYELPLHSLIDDAGDDAESATARVLRDDAELRHAVDQITASWAWATDDVRDVVLSSLLAMGSQLELHRQRADDTPLPRRVDGAAQIRRRAEQLGLTRDGRGSQERPTT